MDYKLSQGKAEIIVLLPHYNDNDRLKKSINSIVEPFPVDVLIIDDGSEIKPDLQELKKIYGDRGNLEIKYNPENVGVGETRNMGITIISQTKYQYIGLMDSDDTNKPNRFSKQLTFLKENPSVSFLGSWGDYYGENGEFLFTMKHAVSDKEIRKKVYLNNVFLHSAILYKREIIENKDAKYKKGRRGEDYRFCFNIVNKYKTANYPEVLVDINIRKGSISSKQRFKQVWVRIRVITENFYFGFYPIWGLFRNFVLLFIPRSFGLKVRKFFKIGKLHV